MPAAPSKPTGEPAKEAAIATDGKHEKWWVTRAIEAPFRGTWWLGGKIISGVREAISRAIKMPLALVGADVEKMGNPLMPIKNILGKTREQILRIPGWFLKLPENVIDALSIGITGKPVGAASNTPAAAET